MKLYLAAAFLALLPVLAPSARAELSSEMKRAIYFAAREAGDPEVTAAIRTLEEGGALAALAPRIRHHDLENQVHLGEEKISQQDLDRVHLRTWRAAVARAARSVTWKALVQGGATWKATVTECEEPSKGFFGGYTTTCEVEFDFVSRRRRQKGWSAEASMRTSAEVEVSLTEAEATAQVHRQPKR